MALNENPKGPLLGCPLPTAITGPIVRGPDPGMRLHDWSSTRGSLSFPVHARQPFMWAYTTPINHGTVPVSLQDVRLVDPSAGLEIRAAFVIYAPYSGGSVPVNSRTFERRPSFIPLRGFSMPPGSAYRVVLELEVPHPGVFTAGGLSLFFSVGSQNHVATFPDLLTVCAPVTASPCKEQPIPTPPPRMN